MQQEQAQSRRQCPLYYFYKSETTGPKRLEDEIIEMGAAVANPYGSIQAQNVFHSLVGAKRPIDENGEEIHYLTLSSSCVFACMQLPGIATVSQMKT